MAALAVAEAAVRPVELERERAGGDPGKEQRNADPYDDGRGAEYERLEKDPERTEQQQDAAENSPARPGDLHGAHVAAEPDGAERTQHEPEPEEYRERSGRKRDVEDQDDAQHDLDDAARQHPAASGDEMFVDR